jgi:GntR family transcriptional regulator
MMKLDKRSTQPLYAQLKELLNERIRLGTYQPGQQIPSELALCEELTLSRPTVRQAIAELVTEGILVIVKGKGTFVAAEPERIDLKGFNAFAFSFLSARDLEGLSQLTVSSVEGNADTDRIFGAAGGTGHTGYWSIQWQLEDDDQVFAICTSLIPVSMFSELGSDLQRNRRMIEITANKYAYLPQKASCKILVRPAIGEEARQLDIARNASVLVATSRLTSRSGNVCESVTAVLRADLVTLGLDAGRS